MPGCSRVSVWGSNRPILIYWNSYLAARLGGIKQKESSWGLIMNNTFLLFYSLKPRSQVWILIYRKWSIPVTSRNISWTGVLWFQGWWSLSTFENITIIIVIELNGAKYKPQKRRCSLFVSSFWFLMWTYIMIKLPGSCSHYLAGFLNKKVFHYEVVILNGR